MCFWKRKTVSVPPEDVVENYKHRKVDEDWEFMTNIKKQGRIK